MKRVVVMVLAKIDAVFDEVLYRPAVVKAFAWLPRWWLCDLARLSVRLDERWQVGFWDEVGMWPGRPCEICGRRSAIHVYGGRFHEYDDTVDHQDDDQPPEERSVLDDREIHTCGWCHLQGRIMTDEDLVREMAVARADSVAWRWRWRVRTEV